MKAKILVIMLLASLVAALPALADQDAERLAVEAAQDWVALVDKGMYAQSWEDASSYFKGAVSAEHWEKTMKAVRVPLGATLSRELTSAKFYTQLPGAPDGKYVVVEFKTSFANKANTVELITPMLDKDGQWRVSGYVLR